MILCKIEYIKNLIKNKFFLFLKINIIYIKYKNKLKINHINLLKKLKTPNIN